MGAGGWLAARTNAHATNRWKGEARGPGGAFRGPGGGMEARESVGEKEYASWLG